MPPSKQYMLNRALEHLKAIIERPDISAADVRHNVQIAMQEVEAGIADHIWTLRELLTA